MNTVLRVNYTSYVKILVFGLNPLLGLIVQSIYEICILVIIPWYCKAGRQVFNFQIYEDIDFLVEYRSHHFAFKVFRFTPSLTTE